MDDEDMDWAIGLPDWMLELVRIHRAFIRGYGAGMMAGLEEERVRREEEERRQREETEERERREAIREQTRVYSERRGQIARARRLRAVTGERHEGIRMAGEDRDVRMEGDEEWVDPFFVNP